MNGSCGALLRRLQSLFAVLSTLLVAAGCAPRPAAPSRLRIGIVDTDRVFQGYDKSQDRWRKISSQADDIIGRVADLRAQHTAAKNEQTKHEAGSPEFEEQQRVIDEIEAKVPDLETQRQQILQAKSSVIAELNAEILREVRLVGSDRGLDLVIEKRMVVQGLAPRPISWSLVHYSRPGIDLTDRVIDVLNRRYRTGAARAEGVGEGGEGGGAKGRAESGSGAEP